MNKSIKDLTGNVYDRLTVIGYSHSENGKTYWKCLCSCDADKPLEERNIHIKLGKYMQDGSTGSCGCKKRDHIKEVSQHTNKKPRTNKPYYSDLSNIWRTMINRCHNPNYKRYQFYGAKGVYVCNEWRNNFDAFYEWSIAHGYTKGMEINRLDQSRNYMPNNCEWMSKGFSASNTCNNLMVTIGNKTLSLAAWSRDPECEVGYSTIRKRYHEGVHGIALIKKEKSIKDIPYTYRKKKQTIEEWSIELNIPYSILRTRYNRGNRGEKLFRKVKKAS